MFATLAFFAFRTNAAPEGKIVIHGANSGSHLRLTVSGRSIVVRGYLAPTKPTGCRVTRKRMVAVCPVAGVRLIELNMGPSGDKIEVLDSLPIPLVTHLGNGSDKLIGNNERDTCFPEGARRNRCIGGGGDDICIMGPGHDGCHGDGGNDRLYGGSSSDQLYGGAGFDYCDGGPGIGKSHSCEAGPGH